MRWRAFRSAWTSSMKTGLWANCRRSSSRRRPLRHKEWRNTRAMHGSRRAENISWCRARATGCNWTLPTSSLRPFGARSTQPADFDGHTLRAERQGRLHPGRPARRQLHIQVRRDGRQNDLTFHQRKLIPDTNALSPTEGQISEARQQGLAPGQETIRIEAERIVEKARIAVQQPGRDQDDLVFSDGEAADRGLAYRCTPQHERRRIQAHRFLHDAQGEWHAFMAQAFEMLRIPGEQIPAPCHGLGRGLMAGEKQGHGFVAHLFLSLIHISEPTRQAE